MGLKDLIGRVLAGLVVLGVAVGLTFVDLPSILQHLPAKPSISPKKEVVPRGVPLPGHKSRVVESIELLFGNGQLHIVRFVTADAICYVVQREHHESWLMEIDCERRLP